MKNKLIVILIFIGLCIGSMAQAQISTSNLKISPDRDIIKETVIERSSEPYVREREIIIRQLEIITGDEETRYIIVPGDTLNISYIDRSEKEEAVYQVSKRGEIHMPLIGAVKVSNLNRKQVRAKINKYMQEYIRHPKVEVSVNISGRYMVAGEVDSPGVYRIRPNLTVMEAVLGAGYDKDSAKLRSVMVMRGVYDDPVVKRLDLNKMIKKGDRTDNIFVKPGDFIYIPKTFISNIEKFKDTIYRYVRAYYGLGRIPGEPAADGDEPDSLFWE